jgi:hypothetical protein
VPARDLVKVTSHRCRGGETLDAGRRVLILRHSEARKISIMVDGTE